MLIEHQVFIEVGQRLLREKGEIEGKREIEKGKREAKEKKREVCTRERGREVHERETLIFLKKAFRLPSPSFGKIVHMNSCFTLGWKNRS